MGRRQARARRRRDRRQRRVDLGPGGGQRGAAWAGGRSVRARRQGHDRQRAVREDEPAIRVRVRRAADRDADTVWFEGVDLDRAPGDVEPDPDRDADGIEVLRRRVNAAGRQDLVLEAEIDGRVARPDWIGHRQDWELDHVGGIVGLADVEGEQEGVVVLHPRCRVLLLPLAGDPGRGQIASIGRNPQVRGDVAVELQRVRVGAFTPGRSAVVDGRQASVRLGTQASEPGRERHYDPSRESLGRHEGDALHGRRIRRWLEDAGYVVGLPRVAAAGDDPGPAGGDRGRAVRLAQASAEHGVQREPVRLVDRALHPEVDRGRRELDDVPACHVDGELVRVQGRELVDRPRDRVPDVRIPTPDRRGRRRREGGIGIRLRLRRDQVGTPEVDVRHRGRGRRGRSRYLALRRAGQGRDRGRRPGRAGRRCCLRDARGREQDRHRRGDQVRDEPPRSCQVVGRLAAPDRRRNPAASTGFRREPKANPVANHRPRRSCALGRTAVT